MYSRGLGCCGRRGVAAYAMGSSPRGVGSYASGLGAIPLLGVATSFVSSIIPGFLSSSDKAKDNERKARIDGEYAKAMSGDQTAVNCLAAMAQGVANNDGRVCAVGSQVAALYAKGKYAEFQARHALGAAATTVLPYAISQSDLPTQAVGVVTGALSSPLVIGGVVLGAFLLLKRGRR